MTIPHPRKGMACSWLSQGSPGVDKPIPLLSRDLGSDVRYGSEADIQPCLSDVRFTPKSGHGLARSRCPFCAI